jgi:hypothetical protein
MFRGWIDLMAPYPGAGFHVEKVSKSHVFGYAAVTGGPAVGGIIVLFMSAGAWRGG